jgi:hypothetical protein
MAPEQIDGEPIGPAADWYALGATLYCALTGRPPFAGAREDVLERKSAGAMPPRPEGPEDLAQLCLDLLRRDPARRPNGDDILRRLGGEPAPTSGRGAVFVGREAELGVLRRASVDAAAGRAVTVLVHGESGVGKSALVHRFLERNVAGALVLDGRCYERESVPYKALDQVIDQLAAHLAALPARAVESILPGRVGLLAEVFPALRKVPVIAGVSARGDDAPTADPFQHRRAVFAALRELLTRLGGRGAVIIGIDDLQWGDADSLALLGHILQGLDAPPVLVCATVRTSGDIAALATLRPHLGDDVRELAVDRLPPARAKELVERLAGDAAASVRADAVVGEAGGHPMFIEALVRHQLAHPGSAGPLRLDDALIARFVDLPAEASEILELVCVAGAPVAQEMCALAARAPFATIADRIAALRAAHLVRTHGVRRQDTVEPYHDRVREAVLARIAPAALPRLHRELARALESSGDADPETLAVHFAAGGELAAAARHADRAAERAAAALAFEQAARLCRWALELDPAGVGATGLRVRLGDALAAAGRGRDAAEVYLAAAVDVPDREQLDLRRRAAEQLLISGCVDEGLTVLRTVLESVGLPMPATPRRALVRLLVNRVRVRLRGGGLRVRLRDPADVSPETLTQIDTCFSAGMGLAIVDTIRGADFQARHILLALDAGEPYRVACALAAEAAFHAAGGGPARARTERLVSAAESLAAQVGHPNALGYAAFAGGTADYLVGRWASGRERCDRAAEIFRERCTGVSWWIDTANYFALECLAYGGELAELSRRVKTLLADAEERGDRYAATNLRIGLPAMAWLCADDLDDGRRQIEEAMAGWSHQGFHIQHLAELLSLGQMDLYLGEGLTAYRRITGAWDAITGAIVFRVQLTRIATYHQLARASLAAAIESPAGSAERRRLVAGARRAASKIAREHMSWGDPLAALARAGAAHLVGDDGAARSELAAAIAGFDAAGMGAYAAAARCRLGMLEGGDAGAALLAAGTAVLAPAVRRPDRMSAVLAPGF